MRIVFLVVEHNHRVAVDVRPGRPALAPSGYSGEFPSLGVILEVGFQCLLRQHLIRLRLGGAGRC